MSAEDLRIDRRARGDRGGCHRHLEDDHSPDHVTLELA